MTSNTFKRVIVSVLAIPFLLGATYLGTYYFFGMVMVIALVSFIEFSLMMKKKSISPNILIGFIAVALLLTDQFRPFIDNYSFYLLLIVLLSLVELFRNKGSAIINIGSTLLAVFYIQLLASALIGIREFYPPIGELYFRGGFVLLSIMATIWICDSAAFFGGTALGKHKLFPRVSPNKSWEGAVFGLVFAVITMLLAKVIILNFMEWKDVIVIGLIVGTIGQAGDLVESLFKRDAGVKDSSALIPGHGGIFDRFDSLLFSAPVILLYMKNFVR
ncbi:MAG: phosphatidate cytidylyltransferase [Ignavibacteriales bacterium]|nr:MAG: phosphatidate cytidylyltransferase [Ignavibacteriales bacterium]